MLLPILQEHSNGRVASRRFPVGPSQEQKQGDILTTQLVSDLSVAAAARNTGRDEAGQY